MNKDGILSDDKMAKMESVEPNGQLVDIVTIDSENDENKIGAETSLKYSYLKEHKQPPCTTMDNNANEEMTITDDDSEPVSFENSLRESDNEQASASEEGTEVTPTEEEVDELVAEFLEVESKAAQSQESLEKKSLDKIGTEVRLELSERLQGDEEQLDAAGLELPRLYKSFECQVPNICETEAWKSRAHWAGSQVPEEANQSIKNADEYLQSCRPVRRKHGRLLEEGASGFLAGKVPVGDDDSVKCHENSWSSFNEFIKYT